MRVERSMFWIVCGVLAVASTASQAEDDRMIVSHGLKAEIFAGSNFERRIAERIDPNVEFQWNDGAPATDAPADRFSIRWTGWIKPLRAGRYKFHLVCDEGARLWIDGKLVVDRSITKPAPSNTSLELSEEPLSLRIEYYEIAGTARVALLWQHLDSPHMANVPPEALFVDELSARAKATKGSVSKTGLTAEYFDRAFRRKLKVTTVPRAETVWGEGGPEWDLPTDLCARYTGFILPPATGKYKFIGNGDDAIRVWIDDKPVLEHSAANPQPEVSYVDLTANEPCSLKIEFTDRSGWGCCCLHWTPPGGIQELSIPPENLFQTKAAALKAVEAGDLK